MDPRNLVNSLLKLRGRCQGWYMNEDTWAINTSIEVIKRFCYPAPPKIVKANGSRVYSCPRCNKKIKRQDFFCSSCGQRILVENK